MNYLLQFLTIAIYLFSWCALSGQEVIQLYESAAPWSEEWYWTEKTSHDNIFNTELVYNVSQPTLTAYLPPYYLATGTAVIIAPGGAFHVLSIEKEGRAMAEYLNSLGVAAFVLKYRLNRSLTDEPAKEMMAKVNAGQNLDSLKAVALPYALEDGLTAVQYIREHVTDFEINPDKIGFMGFSAGGALSMAVVYNSTSENRPDFIASVYGYNHPAIQERIPEEETPIFIVAASDDQPNYVSQSVSIYQKWRDKGHPAELHMYQKGGHGFGMSKQNIPTDTWFERYGEWLQQQGYLKKLYPNKYEQLYGQEAYAKSMKEQPINLMNNYAQLDRYRTENERVKRLPSQYRKVVFLGNSITEGWANANPIFFRDHGYIGRGISGQTSSQLLLRFQQDVLDISPESVIIHIGTNDIAENTGPYDEAYTVSNIRSMIELAIAQDIKVILASVLPHTKFEWNRALGDRSDMIISLNDRLRELVDAYDLTYIDYHSAMTNKAGGMDKELADDGVHPTKYGFEVMQKILMAVLIENGYEELKD